MWRRRRRVSVKSRKDYLEHKEDARVLVHALLEKWNAHYKLPYKKVFIKNLKSRWGSCSKVGNLNFNYRIVYLPPELAEYLIVHELCHLKEFNHGPKFWKLVSECVPDYAKKRRILRKFPMKI